MSSGNLFKSSHYTVKQEETRVIDSNELIADRMRLLSELMEMDGNKDFADDFSVGLDAEQVEALLGDTEEEEEGESGNVIHPAQPEVDIEAITAEARAEAERILDEAGAEARRLVDEANGEAESIRQSAREQGRQEGFEAGTKQAEEEYAVKEQELLQKEKALEEEYQKKYEEMEQQLVSELTEVYEHVLGINLSEQSDVVLHLMKEAISSSEGGRNFFVHVSAQDYAYVSAYREDIVGSVGSVDSVEIIEDMTLKASDCFIECESGIYEGGLGTELSLLKKELRLLSYTKSQ